MSKSNGKKVRVMYVYPNGVREEGELTYDELLYWVQPGITQFKEPVMLYVDDGRTMFPSSPEEGA